VLTLLTLLLNLYSNKSSAVLNMSFGCADALKHTVTCVDTKQPGVCVGDCMET
jgi:hypothetical protein